MKLYLLAFIYLLVIQSSIAQVDRLASVYRPGSTLYVSVYAGLSLRDAPAMSGKVLTVVKFSEPVIVDTDNAKSIAITNSGIPGQWVKVKYKEFTGYQFDGFLSRFKPMEEFNDVRSYGEFQEYLKRNFKVKTSKFVEQDTVTGAPYWEQYHFANGIVYTRSGSETAFMNVAFPRRQITFQEVYLMARSAYPTVFYGKDAQQQPCNYSEGNTVCSFLQDPFIVVQKADTIYLQQGRAGY